MESHNVKILNASLKDPLPKFLEIDFTFEVYDKDGIGRKYNTTLALRYDENCSVQVDEDAENLKTVFVAIDPETGDPLTESPVRMTLSRKDCPVFPPVEYTHLDPSSWSGIEGELTASPKLFKELFK